MIIYGYRNREIMRGTGSFYCAKCEVQRPYKHKKVVRYFTLFFIPLFPLGTLSEYVECGVCGRTYKPEILSAVSTTSDALGSQPMAASDYQSISQSPGISQTTSQPKRNSCLPWILILAGAIFLVFAGIMGIALIAVQSDSAATTSMASFIIAVIICSGPLAVLGAIAMGGGVYLLRTQNETNIL